MVYNFVQYLKDNKPDFNYAINGAHSTTPNYTIIVNENTSVPEPWIDRCVYTLQIFSRADSSVKAREQILEIFSIVDRFWDVILPETTVQQEDGSFKTYEAIKAYQITPLQRPYWFGYDQNGLPEYVFNLKIITK